MADHSLPLALRKNLQDNEKYLLAEQEKIKQATGNRAVILTCIININNY
jgi:hypothetical protein